METFGRRKEGHPGGVGVTAYLTDRGAGGPLNRYRWNDEERNS
jgi:hypothetical protein